MSLRGIFDGEDDRMDSERVYDLLSGYKCIVVLHSCIIITFPPKKQ